MAEKRTRGRLHGGPLDGTIFFPPEGAVEATLPDDAGVYHLYRAGFVPQGPPDPRPTVHMEWAGVTPDEWFDDCPAP